MCTYLCLLAASKLAVNIWIKHLVIKNKSTTSKKSPNIRSQIGFISFSLLQ